MIKIKSIILTSLIVCISCKKNSVAPLEDVSAMKYSVAVNNSWNSQSTAWPDRDAHFSWIGGATHNANVKFWEAGTLASPGIDLMSITGRTTDLISEIQNQIAEGNAENYIDQRHWYCADNITHANCSELSFETVVTKEFPLISLVSMLGPSPDWFIGVESLSMVDSNGIFIPRIVYELFPYDAGILSDNSVIASDCCDREPLSDPQENIHLITIESGETIGSGSIGQIIFTAIPDNDE
jgi:hypothetical protein